MKKIFFTVMLFILISPSFGIAEQESHLRLGVLPVIDTLPLIVAEEKGLFKEEGITVDLVNFNSALERDAALMGNAIDGYFGDLLNTILLHNKGERLKIITSVYHTNSKQRMFALLASPNSNLRDITGVQQKAVAISIASVIEYLLDEIAASHQISPHSVKKLEVRLIPIRYQMLMDDSVSLALLPEPLASKALAEGAHLIADDRVLDETLTIIAVKEKFLQDRENTIIRFMKAYRKSVILINEHPSAFMETLANKTRFPISLKASFVIPPFPEPTPPSHKEVEKIADWLSNRDMFTDQSLLKTLLWEENN